MIGAIFSMKKAVIRGSGRAAAALALLDGFDEMLDFGFEGVLLQCVRIGE
jgi:hypothetical protein